MTTRQIEAWRGDFGEAYLHRNPVTEQSTRRKVSDWNAIMRRVRGEPPANILEVGANVGQNIAALRQLTGADLFAVEPNATARAKLAQSGIIDPTRIFDATADRLPFADQSIDMVFTSGVLIHIPPDGLAAACRDIFRVARRYVLAIEYFSAEPIEKRYRGNEDLLFLRDFGAFYMDSFSDLRVIDFGFFWKPFSGDSMNWWLFSKQSHEATAAASRAGQT